METSLEFRQATAGTIEQNYAVAPAKSNVASIWEAAEASRYGITLLVLALSIIQGSIAISYSTYLNDWQFALVIFPCGFTLISCMALAPLRWLVGIGSFAFIASAAMLFVGIANAV